MGSEYRSLVGFKGGLASPAGQAFAHAAEANAVRLRAGKGDDDDLRGVVWVMDTMAFPFHQAELYHQFHDDMVEAYSSAYHALRPLLTKEGNIMPTGCPRD
mmetsp:Transcript_23057/g.77361  ORF Transcript_23057/g.77361 Transcript_23057/m.77361 type:complete len:101 (+) Transcript_23057:546-848(+)